MGAWGLGNFDNGDALDWVVDLKEPSGLGILEKPLSAVQTKSHGYLEAPECSIALAAAEVVAALCGLKDLLRMGGLAPNNRVKLPARGRPSAAWRLRARAVA